MKIELPKAYKLDVLHLEFTDYRTLIGSPKFEHSFNVGFYTDTELVIETLR